MLSESSIKKVVPISKATEQETIYQCANGHTLKYTFKGDSEVAHNIQCPHCLARGIINSVMIYKGKVSKETK